MIASVPSTKAVVNVLVAAESDRGRAIAADARIANAVDRREPRGRQVPTCTGTASAATARVVVGTDDDDRAIALPTNRAGTRLIAGPDSSPVLVPSVVRTTTPGDSSAPLPSDQPHPHQEPKPERMPVPSPTAGQLAST
jgi:hypothetical protein